MKTRTNQNTHYCRLRNALGTALVCAMVPLAALADPAAPPACRALVAAANDLYLANPNGKVLGQFTADGMPKEEVTVSPDGSRVAYAVQGDNVTSYEVVDTFGRRGAYPVFAPTPNGHTSSTDNTDADSPLMGLSWNSNRVLGVIKHIGPNSSRFEFVGIPIGSAPTAQYAGSPAFGRNCVQGAGVGRVACVTQDGEVTVSDGASGSQIVFSVTGFEGVAPEESMTLAVGAAAPTQGITGYKAQIVSVLQSGVDLKVTLSHGNWEEAVVGAGDSLNVPGGSGQVYGFFPTLTDANSGTVRVDVIPQDSGPAVLDSGIAWLPDGSGLLLIRRTHQQGFVYLIAPGAGDHHWHLTAQAPLSISSTVQAMRVVGPSTLLLEDGSGSFATLGFGISHASSGQNPETLTLGTITPLPTTLTLELNGTGVPAEVLDWSCQVQ